MVSYVFPYSCTARTTVRMLESLIRLAQGILILKCQLFSTLPVQCILRLLSLAAHARLMFRNKVTRLDAIAAILCIESSMMTSAIVDSVGNALHSNFTNNPDHECILLFIRVFIIATNKCSSKVILSLRWGDTNQTWNLV